MENLHNDLTEKASGVPFIDLLETSVKWAEYVLRNNSGKALDSGLNISKELANYTEDITPDADNQEKIGE